ncbi:biosynthetic-type acetolactate synthase large subunit [Candidatus Daviesbacteria bacterium]|nr:biosynthetic-type acetolactate synthase large subunit [Candidatus Daviesbacteria bacterium]
MSIRQAEFEKPNTVSLTAENMSGGQILLEELLRLGVNTIFGYPGGAIMPTYDRLYDYTDRIRHILTRHEQGAIHAAEGFAEMTGKPGVVFVTSGPGALNLVTGLNDALMDSRPIVAISGQVARPLIGTQAFQEAPVIKVVSPITKWAYQVQNANEIPEVVDKAFRIATNGRPGPVLVDIPKDVQNEQAEYYPISPDGHQVESHTLKLEALKQLTQQAADLLNQSQKPLILAGHGILISGAMAELKALAEKAGIPVANTLQGLSSFPTDHYLNIGMLGMHGRYGANVLTNQADVILAIGMRFDDRVTGVVSKYAKQAKIIHIDIDPTQLNRLIQTEIAINADAKPALTVLLEKIIPNQHSEWLDQFRTHDAREYEQVTRTVLAGNGLFYTMDEVINLLSKKTNGEAVIVSDVGQHQMVAAQRYGFKRPNSHITSGGMGTMGFALPAAIGAKLGAPDREVIAVAGDGGFQMNIQELGTIMQEKLPVKVIILKNYCLGMVRQWQDLFHDGRHSFVDMQNPDFVEIAQAYGIPGERVKKPQGLSGRLIRWLSSAGIPIDRVTTNQKDLGRALDRLLTSSGPYLLDVRVQRDENVFPMIPAGAGVNEVRLK